MSETAPTTAYDQTDHKPSELTDWLGALVTLVPIIRRYWWIVAAVAVCLTSLAGLYLFTRADQYRAEATIVLTPGLGQKSDSEMSDMGGSKDASIFINTQLQLLRSNDVIDRAIDRCGATEWPEYADLDRAQLQKKILQSLDISMPTQSALMMISVLAPDANHAQLLVNAVCDSYLQKCKSVMRDIRGERATQEETAGESPQTRYLEICKQVDDYMRDNAIAPEQTINPYEAQLQQVTMAKDQLDRDLGVLQQEVDLATKAQQAFAARTNSLAPEERTRPENDITELLMLPRVLNDETIAKMTTQIFYQEGVVASTQATLGSDNQGLRAQQEMLWMLRKMRREQVQASLDALNLELGLTQQKMKALTDDFNTITTQYTTWRNSLIQMTNLLRLKREAEATYEDVRSNRDRSQILSRMDLLPASTWNEASVPLKPYDQQALLKLFWIFIGSLVVGVLTALGYDRMDNSIRTREDLTKYVHATLLGSIPFADVKEYGAEVVKISVHYPASPVAEAFRTIRTSLNITLPRTPGVARVLMMTSSIPSEGKSSCCCNLASIFAQNSQRVLLIDADLRRPTLHHTLELTGEKGMAEYLAGTVEPDAVIQRSVALGVDVISSGHPPINPAELLSTARYKVLLEWARSRYDWVILDTPPVVPVTDARIMAEHVDGIISVVRSFYTPRPIVQRGMELLRETHTPILGMICNNAEGYELGHYVKGFGYSSYTSYGSYGSYNYSKYTSMSPTGTAKATTEE